MVHGSIDMHSILFGIEVLNPKKIVTIDTVHQMAYQLVLTKEERDAIDWVGHRYWNGDDLYQCILHSNWDSSTGFMDADEDIAFDVPEHIAWEIKARYDEEGCPCFAPELVEKIALFVEKIV